MLESEFVAYKKFTDTESAEQIAELLNQNNIEYHLQDNNHHYVKTITAYQVDFAVILNIRSKDFAKAEQILEAHYSALLNDIEKDYYLYDFSVTELKEVVENPYDWGALDFQLAKKLLADKGITYTTEEINKRKGERLVELSKIVPVPTYKIILGYILAIILPPIGFVLGFLILNNRNLLPDGRRVYIHSKSTRSHGQTIIILSVAAIIAIIVRTTME
jgi:hypothetical protein